MGYSALTTLMTSPLHGGHGPKLRALVGASGLMWRYPDGSRFGSRLFFIRSIRRVRCAVWSRVSNWNRTDLNGDPLPRLVTLPRMSRSRKAVARILPSCSDRLKGIRNGTGFQPPRPAFIFKNRVLIREIIA